MAKEGETDKDGTAADDTAGQPANESAGTSDQDTTAASAAEETSAPEQGEADGAEAADGGGAEAPKKEARKGKAWGEPVARFEAAWTKLETRLITWVLVAQLLSMVAWVLLSGLSSPLQAGNAAGLVMRAVIGAVALGVGLWFATKGRPSMHRSLAVAGGVLVGLFTAGLWRTVGVDYFDNVKAWLQEGSTLTLMGGLRGLATRLTLWLALLGGSLATASGKHINIDVVFRFVPARGRLPIAVLNWCGAALVCAGAVWGFFDHIAIESFGAKAEDTASEKIHVSMERMGDHLFLTRKQLGLDLRTLPHVIKGERFDRWMSAGEWNAWVKDAGFDGRYPPELIESIVVPPDAPPHSPLVLAPDGETTRGILVHDLSLVFPFGMLVLALRFLLRALLALSGHIEVDPDAAHKEEIGHAAVPEKGGA